MSVNLLISRPATVALQALKNVSKCCYATKIKSIVDELNVEETPAYETEAKFTEEEIAQMRNKSLLWPEHYRILHGQRPYNESKEHYHDRVWYKKRVLGRYGIDAVDVPAGICWPSKEDIADKKEYESLAFPSDIQGLWKEIEEQKKEEAEAIRKREEEIDKAMANFEKWKAALEAKVAKKEAELRAAKKKKEKVMQEIKEQIGYNIDPRDERFKQILEQKEKEDKKKKKEEKKKLRAEKLMAYLAKQSQEIDKKVLQSEPAQQFSETSPSASENKVEKDSKKSE
ncbi:growth arrest and DNA-damage-inducible, gamma interacting protein 1 [Nasonia vitripennis]|uniref:Large ribosomal subunit protein mL64 n=1 Tax=Nasonia vitripennis TaxID=7425 RepID=A0A7M6UFG2_NASVI|nr:growth arrest and DNA-damage-inducible, gamma interacting protein 1 [Nasonia vitripennis]